MLSDQKSVMLREYANKKVNSFSIRQTSVFLESVHTTLSDSFGQNFFPFKIHVYWISAKGKDQPFCLDFKCQL